LKFDLAHRNSGTLGLAKMRVQIRPCTAARGSSAARGFHERKLKKTKAADVGRFSALSPAVDGRSPRETTQKAPQRSVPNEKKRRRVRKETLHPARRFQSLLIYVSSLQLPRDESDLQSEGGWAKLPRERASAPAQRRYFCHPSCVAKAHDLQKNLRRRKAPFSRRRREARFLVLPRGWRDCLHETVRGHRQTTF